MAFLVVPSKVVWVVEEMLPPDMYTDNELEEIRERDEFGGWCGEGWYRKVEQRYNREKIDDDNNGDN